MQPNLAHNPVIGSVQTLTFPKIVVGAGGLPERDQLVVRAPFPQNPERQCHPTCLGLTTGRSSLAQDAHARSTVPLVCSFASGEVMATDAPDRLLNCRICWPPVGKEDAIDSCFGN
jgi:hypothetical protein